MSRKYAAILCLLHFLQRSRTTREHDPFASRKAPPKYSEILCLESSSVHAKSLTLTHNCLLTQYSVGTVPNAFAILNTKALVPCVNDQCGDVSRAPAVNDGVWHFVAFTWKSSSGVAKLYVDGQMKKTYSRFARGEQIAPGGTIVIGNRQDSPGIVGCVLIPSLSVWHSITVRCKFIWSSIPWAITSSSCHWLRLPSTLAPLSPAPLLTSVHWVFAYSLIVKTCC